MSMFPKGKILSPEVNKNSQTVNVVISDTGNSNVDLNEVNPYSNIAQRDPGEVHYSTNSSELGFLKLVLKSYMDNPIKYNGYVICTVPLLEQLIETLTGCDDCVINTSDPELNCCGESVKVNIVPVSKIWVKNGDSSEVFKYKYSQYLQLFEEYRISLKLVYV